MTGGLPAPEKTWRSETFRVEDQHWWFVSRRRIVKRMLDPLFPPNGRDRRRVLEVGCGSGGNLSLLATYGRLEAVEPDPEVAAMARSRGVCEVRRGGLPDDFSLDEGFDLVCLLDVLEHVEDDLGSLRNLASLLAPGGRIMLTVPAHRFLYSYHDEAVGNLRRYRTRDLLEVAGAAGLRAVYTTHFNTLLFPAVVVVRSVKTLMGKGGASDFAMPPRPLNALLKEIFSFESLLAPRFALPFGVSLLAVLER